MPSLVICTLLGSPPRGRGKVELTKQYNESAGITPAWAGKRMRPSEHTLHIKDHPRVGGEKTSFHSCQYCVTGSPPRGRGKGRKIQTCWQAGRDHPRVGGEKFDLPAWQTCPRGSPPRGRGKVCQRSPCRCLRRITPAWAGKRHSFLAPHRKKGDHPRVGGEKPPAERQEPDGAGSPPRGRGKVVSRGICARHERITPAWAGKRRSYVAAQQPT